MTRGELVALAARASLGGSAACALALGRRVPRYRPVVETLALAFALDLARWLLRGPVLDPALLLAFPLVSLSLPARVLAGVKRGPAAVALALAWALSVALAGSGSLGSPERVYEALQAASVALQALWVADWGLRAARSGEVSDRSDTVPRTAAALLFAGDAASFFGPFAVGEPRRDWYVAQAQTVLLFAVLNTWQVWQACRLPEVVRGAGPRDV